MITFKNLLILFFKDKWERIIRIRVLLGTLIFFRDFYRKIFKYKIHLVKVAMTSSHKIFLFLAILASFACLTQANTLDSSEINQNYGTFSLFTNSKKDRRIFWYRRSSRTLFNVLLTLMTFVLIYKDSAYWRTWKIFTLRLLTFVTQSIIAVSKQYQGIFLAVLTF